MPNNQTKSAHLKDLLLLLAVPIGIALIAAIAVYLPRLLANPTYDFIYTLCSSYHCDDTYIVNKDGRLALKSDTQSSDTLPYHDSTSLRYYDVRRDATRSISIEEAGEYRLDTSSRSPDNYTLVQAAGGSGGFLFWQDYDDSWYLKDGIKKRKLDIAKSGETVTFMGWVKK